MSAEILRDLSRAKVAFQLRSLRLVMGFRDRDAAEGGDANAAPVPQDQQARPEGIA